MKSALQENKTFHPGGCKLILVVVHFEFLITSEFKIPTNIYPRLPLWSRSLLQTFTTLDTMHGVHLQFGRLSLKHISSTPFNDISNEERVELPECILQYISNKFPSIHNIQEKTILEGRSQKFWETIVTNSIPTLERYIDDVDSTFSNRLASTTIQNSESTTEITNTRSQRCIPAGNTTVGKFPHQDYKDPTSFLSSSDFLDFPMPSNYPPSWSNQDSQLQLVLLEQKFSDCLVFQNSSSIDALYQKSSLTFEDLFKIEKIIEQNSYPVTDYLQVLKDYINNQMSKKELDEPQRIDCTKEKFCFSQLRFIRPDQNYAGNKLYCLKEEARPPASFSKSYHLAIPNQQTISNPSCPTSTKSILGTTTTMCEPHNTDTDIPSFSAITESLNSVPVPQKPSYYQANYSAPGCSLVVPNTNYHSVPRNPNSNSQFLYSNSPLRSFHNSSPKAANKFGTPISDPELYQVLEDYETKCLLREKAGFSSAADAQKKSQLASNQVIFSTVAQTEFYKMMSSLLPHIDISQRIFEIDKVWVDQKTLTVSMRPGCWMNPHTLDCYSKMLNTQQQNRGRQGLIPINESIIHIVGIEDMELLMRPLLNHSDPICADMLSEATVGFSLQNANFVHLPCFNDRQWIVITANFSSGKFFDIMNPDGSGTDKFTSIISAVTFNFKMIFAKTYPNCTAFNIREFDYRFVPVPRTHFRYDTGIFLLQILKTYRGMGVPGFSTVITVAITWGVTISEVQLPVVKAFLQNHGFRLFK